MTGDAPPDEPLPQVLAGGTPLIFDWRPVRWRKTRLMVALVVAAAGHLLVFYLFQVVTESRPQQAPPVREAMILTGNDDATLRLLENLDDRLPAMSGAAPLEDSADKELAALVKGYVPTWQDHRPALKAFPGQGGAGTLPDLMSGPGGMLPPLPAGGSAVPGAGIPPANAPVARAWPVLGFQSGLAARDLRSQPEWPAMVTSPEWPEEGPVSFLLSVEPSGKVSSCLSLGTSTGVDEEEVELLRSVLLKLRFAARRESSEAAWGWVDVLW